MSWIECDWELAEGWLREVFRAVGKYWNQARNGIGWVFLIENFWIKKALRLENRSSFQMVTVILLSKNIQTLQISPKLITNLLHFLLSGPVTVPMVSQSGSPPIPMPVQVPPGHVMQQIVDENGTLRHVILSTQHQQLQSGVQGVQHHIHGHFVSYHDFILFSLWNYGEYLLFNEQKKIYKKGLPEYANIIHQPSLFLAHFWTKM